MDDITIVVDLNNQGVNNLKHLQSLQHVEQVNFVFITDKKRYELPVEINELNGKVQRETTGLEGIVFHVCGTETLHEFAIAYIRDFYKHNNINVQIPHSIRSIFVKENENTKTEENVITTSPASQIPKDEELHFLELLSVEPVEPMESERNKKVATPLCGGLGVAPPLGDGNCESNFLAKTKKINLTFAHNLPSGLDYQIRAVADKGTVLKCTPSYDTGIKTISFIVEKPIPFALYKVSPKGEAEKMPYSCSWTSKGVEWLKCCGDMLLYGGKDNVINIELFTLSKLQELLLAIIKKYYFAVEYDSDIKVIRAYLRSRETGTTGSLVLVNGETSKVTLDMIKKENPEAKIYQISPNATEYGSHDHKLYSLLAEKVYTQNENERFPFDSVLMQEFNSLYQGILSSKIVILK